MGEADGWREGGAGEVMRGGGRGDAGLASEEVEAATGQALEAAAKAAGLAAQEQRLCRWSRLPKQAALDLVHNHPVTWFAWHGRGDYFATVAPTGNTQVLAHVQYRRRLT